MQLLRHKINTFSLPELFLTEKLLELLSRYSIDTYRSRIMNPKTILVELYTLLSDDQIQNPKQYEYAIEEARNLLKNEYENALVFGSISKNHLIGMISDLQQNKDSGLRKKVILAINTLVLVNNKNYSNNLLDSILVHLQSYNPAFTSDEKFKFFEVLQTLLTYFVTELISIKYSKRYLYRFVFDHFASLKGTTFQAGIDALRGLLTESKKKYEVIFQLSMNPEIASNIQLIDTTRTKLEDNINDILDVLPGNLPIPLKNKIIKFSKKPYRSPYFFRVTLHSLDSFSALETARAVLSENLDLIQLGYSNDQIYRNSDVLIIEQKVAANSFYEFKPLQYEMDGAYNDGVDLYRQFSTCLLAIADADIKPETKEKLKSSIRYLRLGNEAYEVEHKFLNYWIGMEYLFSDIKDRSDINDMRKYFSRIHSNIYFKRILNNFHLDIKRLMLTDRIPDYAENQEYLLSIAAYDFIITNLSNDFPLLAHRAEKLKRIIFQPLPLGKNEISALENMITKHTNDIELHIARMYRIRNTIIHNAAINMDIISVSANLRYYLTFILSYTISELKENATMKCLEDFLMAQEISYSSLQNEKFPKEKLLTIKTHFDLIA